MLQREGKTATRHEELASNLGFASAEDLFEAVGKDEFSLRTIETFLRPIEPLPAADDWLRHKINRKSASASTGGVFDTYAVVQGIDRFIPVDMYVPGCPPRPEQLIQAIIDLQDKIQREGTITGREFDTAGRQLRKRALVEMAGPLTSDASRNPMLQRELAAAADAVAAKT